MDWLARDSGFLDGDVMQPFSRTSLLGLSMLLSACAIGDVTEGTAEQPLSALEHGRNIWFNNTYGGEKFFTFLANHPDPAKRITIGFKNVVETPRAVRFDTWGVINDPDCVANPAGGADLCPDPTATGVVGMRKFPGPGGTTMYGSSCAGCHAGFDPLHPPANPNAPTWANIHATIGNQYAKFGKMFAANLAPTDPRGLVFASWADGTVDTQLLFSDNIHNPGVVTAFWEWPNRPLFEVGREEPQLRNGQGGEDDLGPDIAALRVYTNIGVCFQQCTAPAVALNKPIDLAACRASCPELPPEADLADLGAYLGSFRAPQFPGKPNAFLGATGEHVFNQNCRGCHDTRGGKKSVLSNDEVNALVADPANTTNSCRAKSTMWERNRLWAEFSSEEYKLRVEAGNRGYRTMPLGGIWSTAPFTHNQGIGYYAPPTASPIERALYFWASMDELLKPAREPKINRIPVALGPFPAGTPTTLVFSRDPSTGAVLCDDVVENHGHHYGSQLDAFSKVALIYWLQYQ
jgi:mono/diheme cytochrome c family protein